MKIKEVGAKIKDLTDEQKKSPEKCREELVKTAVGQAAGGKLPLKNARLLCLDVIALYADDPNLKPLVEKAKPVPIPAAGLRAGSPGGPWGSRWPPGQ
jgi:hypothetical protein